MAEEWTGGDDDLEVHSLAKFAEAPIEIPNPYAIMPFLISPNVKYSQNKDSIFIHLLWLGRWKLFISNKNNKMKPLIRMVVSIFFYF